MRKSIHLFCMIVLVLILLFQPTGMVVEAEGLSTVIKTSANQPETSQTVTLTIAINSAMTVTNYDCVLQYNPAYFSYVNESYENLATGLSQADIYAASDSTFQIVAFGGSQDNCTNLFKMRFRALQPGSAQFTLTDTLVRANDEDEYPASSSKTITIVAPIVLSSNNNLQSLEINPGTLNPSFSASQTSYAVEIAMGVSQITVSAIPEDAKASIAVSGNKDLQDGPNEIAVVVTAENGNKKTYTIIATRAAPTPTPEATPTPPVTLALADGTYTIQEPPPETAAPDGFYHSLTVVDGQMVPVFKALKGDLQLFYLVGPGGRAGFYYYESQGMTYWPYQVITLPGHTYPILSPDITVSVPAGFIETDLNLNGQTYPAWRQEAVNPALAGRNLYLVYLMDNRGEKDFFWLDKDSLMLALYLDDTDTNSPAPTQSQEPTPEPTPGGTAEGTTNPFDPWQLASGLLAFACLVLVGVIIWLATRLKRRRSTGYNGSVRVDATAAELDGGRERAHLKKPKIRRVD